MRAKLNDPKVIKIINYLIKNYDCHTIILYGSHSRGEGTPASDYDILAIRDKGKMESVGLKIDGALLDAGIYPMEDIQNFKDIFVRVRNGVVLCQKDNIADQFLENINTGYLKGPKKRTDMEKQDMLNWCDKNIARVKAGGILANFRHHDMLTSLLDGYFYFRDLWYLGPKDSFQWLKTNDIKTYEAFEEALKPGASIESLERLTDLVHPGRVK